MLCLLSTCGCSANGSYPPTLCFHGSLWTHYLVISPSRLPLFCVRVLLYASQMKLVCTLLSPPVHSAFILDTI